MAAIMKMRLRSVLRTTKMTNEQKLDILKDKRTKCIIYTRVMGYHRPVESFNVGKTGEHKERKQFKI